MSVHAWLLNVDGDDELRDGRRRDPFAALERHPALADALAPLLAGGVRLGRGERAPEGAVGFSFRSTPSAHAALIAAGARPVAAPPLDVQRRVTDRRFALSLPGGVPGAIAAASIPEVERALAGEAQAFVLKRVFGYAGRGRLILPRGSLGANALPFVTRSLEQDGALAIEPWLARTGDLAVHGYVAPGGEVHLGRVTVQTIEGAGVWRGSRVAAPDDLVPPERDQLLRLAQEGAEALRGAGYFGPFGLDAIRWSSPSGPALARCEINARYTMGWATGMGPLRPDLVSAPG